MVYSVDWPNAEYHEILPNLFLGGHVWKEEGQVICKDARHSSISEDDSWDYVVSACLEIISEKSFPACDTRFVLFDDTEGGLSEDVWNRISNVVDEVVSRWLHGQKILIRCRAGYNRSGMIMCLVLMSLGFMAQNAITIVRNKRGKDVLVNPAFEREVREREKEYYSSSLLPETTAIIGDRWLEHW